VNNLQFHTLGSIRVWDPGRQLCNGALESPTAAWASHPKGLMAVEHYHLVVRIWCTGRSTTTAWTVVCNWLLKQRSLTSQALGPGIVFSPDPGMARWLGNPRPIDLPTFLGQRTYYPHRLITWMRWRQRTRSLRNLGRLLRNRQLLKAMDVGRLDRGGQLQPS